MRHYISRLHFSEEIIRYGFVAATALFVEIVSLVLLRANLKVEYFTSVTVAYAFGTLWNYFWSTHWAFSYRRLERHSLEFSIFLLIAICTYFATILFMAFLRAIGVQFIVEARLISACVVAIVGFGFKKLLLFTNFNSLKRPYLWYSKAPFVDRLHVVIRRMTLPLNRLLRHVPPHAVNILSIGVGHGLELQTIAYRRHKNHQLATLYGVDIDERKLRFARLAAKKAGLAITYATELPAHEQLWDAILIIDVLYLLSQEHRQAMIREAIERLAPRGRLLIKGMALTPRWKVHLLNLQERIMVRLFGLTKSDRTSDLMPVDLTALAAEYDKKSYHTSLIPLDSGWIYPHLLLVISKDSL